MKTKTTFRIATALALTILNVQFSIASAQGILTPPGPPAPSMLSLNQIEPRTPISSAPYTISQPGSYYLTTNLNLTSGLSAITIAANGVTLDLSGFTISSTSYPFNLGSGILISNNLSNITIKNGFIDGGTIDSGNGTFSGGGFGYGINCSANSAINVYVSHISVSGVAYYGINLGLGVSTLVDSCTVNTASAYGIVAVSVEHCVAADCGYSGIIASTVTDSTGYSVYPIDGDGGINSTLAQNCYGSSVSGDGLDANQAINCSGTADGNGDGLYAQVADNCYGFAENFGDGIDAVTVQNCYGESFGNGTGILGFNTQNSYGESAGDGDGITTTSALNCYGYGYGSGTGLNASCSAIGCFGYSYSGTGLIAFIANICHGQSQTSTSLSTSHNIYSY
jgi:hypothetical protein